MGMAKEFREFAVKGNVMDLAVGVIAGAAARGSAAGRNPGPAQVPVVRDIEVILIFQARQGFQYFPRVRATKHRIVFADSSIPENDYPLCEFRDIMLVGDQDDGQTLVIE